MNSSYKLLGPTNYHLQTKQVSDFMEQSSNQEVNASSGWISRELFPI